MVRPRKSLEPWIKDDVNYYDHQIEGIRWLTRQKSFLLGDDMGLGKCLQSLTVFAIDVVRGWAETCIIVCPTILKENWADEIKKFTRFPFVILDGNPVERAMQLIEFDSIVGPKILIVNYEQVSPYLKTFNSWGFNVSIYDECHALKNPESKRGIAALGLYTHRNFMLSGTPMLNTVDDLWTALHKIDPVGYPDYWRYVNRYCLFGGSNGRKVMGVKNEDELTRRLQRVMLRRLKEDVLDLPPVQIIERKVYIHPEQQEIYDKVQHEDILTTLDGDEDIEYAIAKFVRLKQICGTTMQFTGDDISAKLDLGVADDLEVLASGKKVIMFTQFRETLDCYTNRLESCGVRVYQLHGDVPQNKRLQITKNWSANHGAAVIACMYQVANVGVNLVAASDINMQDELFVPGLNQQAIDRAHRIGTDKSQPVRVRKYIAADTIENRIQQILKQKKKLSARIVDSDINWKRALVEAVLEDEEDAA